ncbi:hypothetical protein BCY91_00235 [Pelobium manganitolerans]|uniref:HTH tetR-type domain-containing protein n=1 Tax=Pelobium manganitolerans TaxID=1842495 RepID=A0A419SB84_9SPHI|nr:TetR/AcrR family transcriptional regulator [Pelobium manganitolerans]RKD20092.1 hypothetical protein BCY91_00235 [Pelobium manganitolerans]
MGDEKLDKRNSILEVAEELFSELGFDATTTRLIAKKADVNIAMLNYYFGGKEGLYLAILEKHIAANHSRLQTINSDNISSFDKLNKFIDGYVDHMQRSCAVQKLMYMEMSISIRNRISEHIVGMLSKNLIEIKKIISDGVANGSFAQVDAEMLIASMFGTKVYLINASPMASLLFKGSTDAQELLTDDVVQRLKDHYKKMFKLYLSK